MRSVKSVRKGLYKVMNGYTVMANSYRKLMEQGEIDKETAEKEIRIYEFLATCDDDDKYIMVDSSAFNDIIRAFVKMAVVNANIDEEAQAKVIQQLRYIFDENSSKKVLENYRW